MLVLVDADADAYLVGDLVLGVAFLLPNANSCISSTGSITPERTLPMVASVRPSISEPQCDNT